MGSSIAGVRVTDLKQISNDRGGLMEVQRSDEPDFPGFGQAYVTRTLPGVIKAWYRHRHQIDQLAAVTGRVKLVLFDDRESSSSCGAVEEIMVGAPTPRLVLIPPGIWHGFQAVDGQEAVLLHLNTEPFCFESPDEERALLDDPRIPYRW